MPQGFHIQQLDIQKKRCQEIEKGSRLRELRSQERFLTKGEKRPRKVLGRGMLISSRRESRKGLDSLKKDSRKVERESLIRFYVDHHWRAYTWVPCRCQSRNLKISLFFLCFISYLSIFDCNHQDNFWIEILIFCNQQLMYVKIF